MARLKCLCDMWRNENAAAQNCIDSFTTANLIHMYGLDWRGTILQIHWLCPYERELVPMQEKIMHIYLNNIHFSSTWDLMQVFLIDPVPTSHTGCHWMHWLGTFFSWQPRLTYISCSKISSEFFPRVTLRKDSASSGMWEGRSTGTKPSPIILMFRVLVLVLWKSLVNIAHKYPGKNLHVFILISPHIVYLTTTPLTFLGMDRVSYRIRLLTRRCHRRSFNKGMFTS
mgnify:CR=1 FL=1